MRNWVVTKWHGLVPYVEAWDAMKAFTDARDQDTLDVLWLMRHFPVYTQGLAGRAEHVLNPENIPIIQTDRGGQVTYHGPGQLMMYALFDVGRLGLTTRDYVRALEQVVIDVLSDFGVRGSGKVDAPGVYVEDKKIASIGLRVRKGYSYHGCSLNIMGDLEPFQGINPCGYEALQMTSIAHYVSDIDSHQVISRVCHHFGERFGFSIDPLLLEKEWESYESK